MKIEVGTVIHGYGWGYWGRDNYDDKVCIATGFYNGERYAVFYHGGSSLHERFSVIDGPDLYSVERLIEEDDALIDEMK